MTCPTPGQCGCWAEAAEQGDTDAYIEAVTHTWAAPPLPTRLHESLGSLYSTPQAGTVMPPHGQKWRRRRAASR